MNIGCPICHSNRHKTYYETIFNYPYASLVQCEVCGHIYSLITKEVDTNELYNDEVYRVVENRGSVYDKILDWEYTRVIRKIDLLLPGRGSLLDFGCGKGKFGWLAMKDRWVVKCVETSTSRSEYARKVYHLEVNTAFYDSGRIFEDRFNAITLFHVLEHLPNPKELTGYLTRDNLKQEGLLVIEVPNIKSWQSSLAKEKWMHLDVPRHINHFTKKTLMQMMRDIGFIPVRTAGFSFHLGVLGMLDSLLKLCGYKKNIIFELKNRKTIRLALQIAFILPIALLLECMAVSVGRGGITRMYLKFK
jgi:2-polyprenyl-3-methyl-5-hydroxy-6-metoxy-1,4-benzoquinol methylase